MSGLEKSIFIVFSWLPFVFVAVAIPFLIAGIISKRKGKKYRKLLIIGGIFLGLFLLHVFLLFVAGMIGFGPGRFD